VAGGFVAQSTTVGVSQFFSSETALTQAVSSKAHVVRANRQFGRARRRLTHLLRTHCGRPRLHTFRVLLDDTERRRRFHHARHGQPSMSEQRAVFTTVEDVAAVTTI
jgi:hypothetical protein